MHILFLLGVQNVHACTLVALAEAARRGGNPSIVLRPCPCPCLPVPLPFRLGRHAGSCLFRSIRVASQHQEPGKQRTFLGNFRMPTHRRRADGSASLLPDRSCTDILVLLIRTYSDVHCQQLIRANRGRCSNLSNGKCRHGVNSIELPVNPS